ncbi:MAG TPA: CAP domain-containing protein [Actinocrinis sp.]|nr:CAP domain-containing protein [Actinocrinis sp.]
MIALENAARAHVGCAPLHADPAITKAATEHARDMGTKHYLDHNSPAGATPWDRMKAAGYNAPAAENIADGYATPEDVVAGWMDDAPHKANILNCSVKATGVGYFRTDKPAGVPTWAQDFGFR